MAKKKIGKKLKVKKAPAKQPSIADTINTEIIAAAFSSVNQTVLLKVCRLCEAKDGPFLNIFDADKVTARKIEVVMPFKITENDDLPHKICFRCSAKVEELFEFIQKCIKTQENLQKAILTKPVVSKTKHREKWEEKLNQSNISNEDICNALIKKAMEGIKDIPLSKLPIEEEKPSILKKQIKKSGVLAKKEDKNDINNKTCLNETVSEEIGNSAKTNKAKSDKLGTFSVTRSTRANADIKTEDSESEFNSTKSEKETPKHDKKGKSDLKKIDKPVNTNSVSEVPQNVEEPKQQKPFDIMDHVSMIKVNGVGVLFQCKICNRNFLKKDVVMSHACAKNGSAKIEGPKPVIPPEPPKVLSTVKYITTKVTKDDKTESDDKIKDLESKKPLVLGEPITLDDDDDDKPLATTKLKPKIGPASKVKRKEANEIPVPDNSLPSVDANHLAVMPPTPSSQQSTIIQFPSAPSFNSRYKLMPGPNNTFTLVEEKNPDPPGITSSISAASASVTAMLPLPNVTPAPTTTQANITKTVAGPKSRTLSAQQKLTETSAVPSESKFASDRPYPVGLIKSVSHSNTELPINTGPFSFPTPAMKKQSYTVVQTGNPSKLLISTKPPPPPEEPQRKRQKKLRHKEDEPSKEPFSVTLEDAAPPRDPGMFTFINVDPLLQPSYVLPTDNIIQESQISTSTSVAKQNEEKDSSKYTCNMCNEKFTREKKLLAHIQSHYTKMDEEDRSRADKNPRKRTRK